MKKMRRVRTHKFNGVKYHIEVDEHYIGWCDRPRKPDPKEYPAIRLPNGLPYGDEKGAREALITLLHECRHAQNWDETESTVDRVANEEGSLLWRLGYRRVKK